MQMAQSPLDNLVKAGLLKEEPPLPAEIETLIEGAERRLADAETAALSREGRFDLLYNAAHALSLAALRRQGYRPRQKRYIVFQALAHTLNLPPEKWRVLDQAHTARNQFEYHGEAAPSEKVLEALSRVAREMLELLRGRYT